VGLDGGQASRRTLHAASYWSATFMLSILPGKNCSVNPRGAFHLNPLRDGKISFDSHPSPHIVKASSLENHNCAHYVSSTVFAA
jgi:hypothetical protein